MYIKWHEYIIIHHEIQITIRLSLRHKQKLIQLFFNLYLNRYIWFCKLSQNYIPEIYTMPNIKYTVLADKSQNQIKVEGNTRIIIR